MENFCLRAATKGYLCLSLREHYGLSVYSRNITVMDYTRDGFIQSFALKLGSNNYICFSFDDYYHKYQVVDDLTCEYNKHVLSLKSKKNCR